MATSRPIRIAISGAAGRIGYSLLFRIANGGLFGHEQPVALSLLDLPERLPRLEACAMELRDCAFPAAGRPADRVRSGADVPGSRLGHPAGRQAVPLQIATGSTCSARMHRS